MVPQGATNYTFSTGSSIAQNVQSSAVYTVIGAYPNGCKDTALAYLTVYPHPTITANSGTICAGQSFTIVPNGASTYTFSSGSAIVTPSVTKTFSVTGTSTNGCVSPISGIATVTVHQLPNVQIQSPGSTLCNGQLITFTATGAKYYVWTGGATSSTIALTFALGTIAINVSAVDSNGCAGSNTINLVITNCDGIGEIDNAINFVAAPNPTKGKLTLNVSQSGTLYLRDALGKTLFEKELAAGSSDIDVSNFANGLYYLQYTAANKQKIIKITKTD